MYFVYDGTVDAARPRLYSDAAQADEAWDDTGESVDVEGYRAGEEAVEVMPYYCHDDQTVAFLSRASKLHMLITGPRDFLAAIEAQSEER
ncbi:hypothetical protein G3O00_40775 [Burkholderia sp. Ac-20384]|nr:hypothetical protein [Burkholderia sp. Ac-20384]MBN3829862.1 hypothetical protein [Burkholderia sp. Ac-20384]HDR9497172.1 hypothetical protein [Burkholderia cepacia]